MSRNRVSVNRQTDSSFTLKCMAAFSIAAVIGLGIYIASVNSTTVVAAATGAVATKAAVVAGTTAASLVAFPIAAVCLTVGAILLLACLWGGRNTYNTRFQANTSRFHVHPDVVISGDMDRGFTGHQHGHTGGYPGTFHRPAPAPRVQPDHQHGHDQTAYRAAPATHEHGHRR